VEKPSEDPEDKFHDSDIAPSRYPDPGNVHVL